MTKKTKKNQQIVIYQGKGLPKLEVFLKKDTVWLTQKQIASLFGVNIPAISKHIRNIYSDGELKKQGTVSKMETVQKEGERFIKRNFEFYNLDMIISVGYRVNSKRATSFRIWATSILKKYLVDGLVLNTKRLKDAQGENLNHLEGAVQLLRQTIERRRLCGDESKALLELITDYTHSWIMLQQYDEKKLKIDKVSKKKGITLSYGEARSAIDKLKKDLLNKKGASDLFGKERDQDLGGILGNVFQTFGSKDLYGSIEEKAAHILYFVIKDHPFVDGNKRIGSFLFIWFLMRNKYLYNKKGESKINDNALVALALLVAESHPKQKDLMVRLVINLIGSK